MVISYSYMDTTIIPNLIYFDVQVSGFGPNVGYPGFVLLDQIGDTLAMKILIQQVMYIQLCLMLY